MNEYVIWCDESDKVGKYFSNFYGASLVRSKDLTQVIDTLNQTKHTLNFFGEVKWNKVTSNYLQKYIDLIDSFFDLVENDLIKVRIMFTQNSKVPANLSQYHIDHEFQILYYYMLKHSFGLEHSNPAGKPVYLRAYFDNLPDTKEKNETFKDFIYNLRLSKEFKKGNIKIRRDDIAEVISHNHVVLQCTDIVLGAMNFRLNDMHKEKLPGKKNRGKRTIAKEKLYKHILKRIRLIYPGFNIGISTGKSSLESPWVHSYRHWKFVPKNHSVDFSKSKP